MRRDRVFFVVALGLALHALLAFGLRDLVPALLRLPLAFVLIVLLPGYAFVAITAAPPGGWWLAPGWALGFGVAWNGLLVLATRLAGQPFTVLATLALPVNAALWLLVLAHPRRFAGGGPVAGVAATGTPPLPSAAPGSLATARVALALVLAAAAIAAFHAAVLGTPVTALTDSPDHIGTIRRMLETGDAFPANAFFRDAGRAGIDPRKGLWHPQVALIARLAAVDPYDAWRRLSALIAPLFALNAGALGFLIGGPVGAAIAAWALVLTYGGSLASGYLREAVLATKLADQLALATTVAVLADLARPAGAAPGGAVRGTRRAALGLGLGAVAAHVFTALQFVLVFAALGIGLLVRDRGPRALRRLALATLPLGLVALPYLLWRARVAYAPANPIHTETQGLLTLWDHARVVMPGVLWDWMGRLWVLFPFAWWPLWRHGRGNVAVLYLLTTSLAVALVIFDPPVVALLEPRLGYLLMRMVWLVPNAGLLAWLLPALIARARAGPRPLTLARVALALVTLLLLPVVLDAGLVLVRPGRFAAVERELGADRWRGSLEWIDRALPPGQVVLSDPGTSYTVPMFTQGYVVCMLDQHSSPNDPNGLRRILDARDALDPYEPWERMRDVVARYGVTLVVLNDRWTENPPFDYWAPSPEWFAAAHARLDAHPEAFERIADEGDFAIYRVHPGPLARLAGAPPRPDVSPYDPARAPIGRRLGENLPVLHALALAPGLASPGDTVRGVAQWRALAPLPSGSYRVAVRFDRALPGGLAPPRAIAKPVRKLVEAASRRRYRFRADHLPARGGYGVDLWKPVEMVRDSFELEVPGDVADGVYLVRIQMIRQPHYPNLTMSDYLSDDDFLSGIVAGRLVVARDKAHPPVEAGEDGGGH